MMPILTSGEMIGMRDIVKQLSEVTGKTVTFEQEDPQAFIGRMKAAGFGSDAFQVELAENLTSFNDVGYYCGKPVTDVSKLARRPRTWKEYAAAQDWSHVLP